MQIVGNDNSKFNTSVCYNMFSILPKIFTVPTTSSITAVLIRYDLLVLILFPALSKGLVGWEINSINNPAAFKSTRSSAVDALVLTENSALTRIPATLEQSFEKCWTPQENGEALTRPASRLIVVRLPSLTKQPEAGNTTLAEWLEQEGAEAAARHFVDEHIMNKLGIIEWDENLGDPSVDGSEFLVAERKRGKNEELLQEFTNYYEELDQEIKTAADESHSRLHTIPSEFPQPSTTGTTLFTLAVAWWVGEWEEEEKEEEGEDENVYSWAVGDEVSDSLHSSYYRAQRRQLVILIVMPRWLLIEDSGNCEKEAKFNGTGTKVLPLLRLLHAVADELLRRGFSYALEYEAEENPDTTSMSSSTHLSAGKDSKRSGTCLTSALSLRAAIHRLISSHSFGSGLVDNALFEVLSNIDLMGIQPSQRGRSTKQQPLSTSLLELLPKEERSGLVLWFKPIPGTNTSPPFRRQNQAAKIKKKVGELLRQLGQFSIFGVFLSSGDEEHPRTSKISNETAAAIQPTATTTTPQPVVQMLGEDLERNFSRKSPPGSYTLVGMELISDNIHAGGGLQSAKEAWSSTSSRAPSTLLVGMRFAQAAMGREEAAEAMKRALDIHSNITNHEAGDLGGGDEENKLLVIELDDPSMLHSAAEWQRQRGQLGRGLSDYNSTSASSMGTYFEERLLGALGFVQLDHEESTPSTFDIPSPYPVQLRVHALLREWLPTLSVGEPPAVRPAKNNDGGGMLRFRRRQLCFLIRVNPEIFGEREWVLIGQLATAIHLAGFAYALRRVSSSFASIAPSMDEEDGHPEYVNISELLLREAAVWDKSLVNSASFLILTPALSLAQAVRVGAEVSKLKREANTMGDKGGAEFTALGLLRIKKKLVVEVVPTKEELSRGGTLGRECLDAVPFSVFAGIFFRLEWKEMGLAREAKVESLLFNEAAKRVPWMKRERSIAEKASAIAESDLVKPIKSSMSEVAASNSKSPQNLTRKRKRQQKHAYLGSVSVEAKRIKRDPASKATRVGTFTRNVNRVVHH